MQTHLGMKIFFLLVFLLENVMPEAIKFTEKFWSVIVLRIYYSVSYSIKSIYNGLMAITMIGSHFKVSNILSHFVFKKLSMIRFVKPVLEIYRSKTPRRQ